MHPFSLAQPADVAAALAAARATPRSTYIAGGTNLLDLMKENVATPQTLIDLRGLADLRGIDERDSGLWIGALERLSDVAQDARIAGAFPLVAQALLASASPQLRNMATIGGNLLQRTRCGYFRDVAFPCNKREPGSGCPAIAGENRMHAVLGTSDACIATHASDLAVALVALEAIVHTSSTDGGQRAIPIGTFYLTPGASPERENVLGPGELITAIEIPRSAVGRRSVYLKVRDRASYEFALVSAAVALRLEDGLIADARVAFGGVATVPWRSHEAEAALRRCRVDDEAARWTAGDVAVREARPARENGFKIELMRRTLVRALETLLEAG